MVYREAFPLIPGLADGALALLLAVPVPAALDHAPVDCVPYDRYTRITATAPGPGIAGAQLQFRAGEGGWYSVAMAAGAGGREWSAVLPRPVRPLARLDYRIVTRTSDAAETVTGPFPVRVADGPECGRAAQSSPDVAEPIVVRLPDGAPLVPPVPKGFSPAGVVAAAEAPARSSRLKMAAIGAGLGFGVAAAALASQDDTLPLADLLDGPEFTFAGMAPSPGSVLSFSRDQVSVFVGVTGGRGALGNIGWNLDFIGAGGQTVCAFMGGFTAVTAVAPTTVVLTGTLRSLGACGQRFDVDRARLRVTLGRQSSIQEIPASFRFEP
jgi:hypothetical protein